MSTDRQGASSLAPTDSFARRHLGSGREDDFKAMLSALGYTSLEALVDATVPDTIRQKRSLDLPAPRGEHQVLADLSAMARKNQLFRSFIGMGYSETITPPVILRNVVENPGWYTAYTPYQAEIAQGRLEALLVYQTMVADLTAMPLANASLLDEGTAAAEAMHMCHAFAKEGKHVFFVAEDCHPQTIAVVETRARALKIEVQVGPVSAALDRGDQLIGVLVQYPTSDGRIVDYSELAAKVHAKGALLVVAADLLALALLRAPGEFGADVAVGSTQRFGVPMGFGGPHAGYLATKDEYKRQMPGRLIGVSKDADGQPAIRMSLQTREQHIRREKATSNICTSQVLLAVMAGLYAVYHGPEGLKAIARRIHLAAATLAEGLRRLGLDVGKDAFFDTLKVRLTPAVGAKVLAEAVRRRINLRSYPDGSVGVSLGETVSADDLKDLFEIFAAGKPAKFTPEEIAAAVRADYPAPFARASAYLAHPVFNSYHAEHEMLRFLHRLESRDLTLNTSMISLGSCTMKLSGTSEMMPITWPEFANLHPFAPADQARGYAEMIHQLESWLTEITGFAAVSLQPNAGSQGEYSGLLVIRAYHQSRGQAQRDVCLIPVSAHGTNPASAVTAGFKVVVVACDDKGNVDLADLERRAAEHHDTLGALMITYPSTHGVFEEGIKKMCEIVHAHGGQVYMDGANMNAQVGLTSPGAMGADVCHLNLHKTFAIPHGGGGPGVGPIGVAKHLLPFLPGSRVTGLGGPQSIGSISAAPYGSASVLPISWVYIALMGAEGLTRATAVAILNANYMAKRLEAHYPILYTGRNGRVAHEFIADCRPFKKWGVEAEDIAKRLMDYGFHAPTMSFPVPGTLMIEPTESESKAELDRFCDAMISIRQEIRAIEEGRLDAKDNPLKNAPHTARRVSADQWNHAYSREQAAYPYAWSKHFKFWPAVARIDNPYGDRNLVCSCPPLTVDCSK